MLLNLRPGTVAALNTVIEDMSERFDEEQQEQIVTIIAEVLGQFEPAPAQEEEDVDVSMDQVAAS